MTTHKYWLVISLMAATLVGSCAGSGEGDRLTADGAANHPITVEPSYRSLKLTYAGGLSAQDNESFEDFVADYLAHGNGAISIAVPSGPGASQTIRALGDQIVALGVPRSHILVGVDDQTGSDTRVEIGYVTYGAHTDACGDWSVDAADTADNSTMPNFGCSVQQNIAAQIADPRDLTRPRNMSPADATRRMIVLGKYEQAQTTSADKTKDQSAAVSDVGAAQ